MDPAHSQNIVARDLLEDVLPFYRHYATPWQELNVWLQENEFTDSQSPRLHC